MYRVLILTGISSSTLHATDAQLIIQYNKPENVVCYCCECTPCIARGKIAGNTQVNCAELVSQRLNNDLLQGDDSPSHRIDHEWFSRY